MSKLHKIVAPQLTDVGFGDNIKKQFENINENFQKLSNYDFTKGEKGDSITIEDVKLEENESIKKDIFSTLWEYRSQYLINSEDEDVNEKENLFLEKTGYNIESYLQNATFRYIVQNDERIGSLPFIYVDERFHHKGVSDHIKENVDLYDDEIDLSCVIMYNNNAYEIIRNFPNLYYDEDAGQLCWQWLGKQTGVLAQGPQGPQGTSTKLLISTVDEIREDGLALVTSIKVSGFAYGDIQKNEDGTHTYNGILVNDTTNGGLHKGLNLAKGENIVGWPTIVLPNNSANVIYVTQFQSVKDENDQEKYYVTVNESNIVDLGFSIDKFWQKTIETPLAKGRGFALPVYKYMEEDILLNWDKEKGGYTNLLYTHPLTNDLVFQKTKVDKDFKPEQIDKGEVKKGLNIYYDTTICPPGLDGILSEHISFTSEGIKFFDNPKSLTPGTTISSTEIETNNIIATKLLKVGSETAQANYAKIFSKSTNIKSPLTTIDGDATITGGVKINGDTTFMGLLKTQNIENSDQITSDTIKAIENINTPILSAYNRINTPELRHNNSQIKLENGINIISKTKLVEIGNNTNNSVNSVKWVDIYDKIDSIEFVIDTTNINYDCKFIIYASDMFGQNIPNKMIAVGREGGSFFTWHINKGEDNILTIDSNSKTQIYETNSLLKINIPSEYLNLNKQINLYIYPLDTTYGIMGTWIDPLDKETSSSVLDGNLPWEENPDNIGGGGSNTGGESGDNTGGESGDNTSEIVVNNAIKYYEIVVNGDVSFKDKAGSVYKLNLKDLNSGENLSLLYNIKLPVVSSVKFEDGIFSFSIFESIYNGIVNYSSTYHNQVEIYDITSPICVKCWITTDNPFGFVDGNYGEVNYNANLKTVKDIFTAENSPNYSRSYNENSTMNIISSTYTGDHTVKINGSLTTGQLTTNYANVIGNLTTDNATVNRTLTVPTLNTTTTTVNGTLTVDNATFDSLKVNNSQEGQILMANGSLSSTKPFKLTFGDNEIKPSFSNGEWNFDLGLSNGESTYTLKVNHNSPYTVDIKWVKFLNLVQCTATFKCNENINNTTTGNARTGEMTKISDDSLPTPCQDIYCILYNPEDGTKDNTIDNQQQAGIEIQLTEKGKVNLTKNINPYYQGNGGNNGQGNAHATFMYICK